MGCAGYERISLRTYAAGFAANGLTRRLTVVWLYSLAVFKMPFIDYEIHTQAFLTETQAPLNEETITGRQQEFDQVGEALSALVADTAMRGRGASRGPIRIRLGASPVGVR